MNAFILLSYLDEEDRKETREALLAYCKLDTLAMVQVLSKLRLEVLKT